MKKIILTAIISLVSALGCLASDFEVDGLKYTITNLKNPSTVKIDGVASDRITYAVISDVVKYGAGEFTVEESLPVALFKDCKYLKKVEIKREMKELPMWFFYGCSSLTEVTGIENVSSIGPRCFGMCTMMSNYPIFKNVGKIEVRAFEESGITDLSIFPNITVIDDYAFLSCKKLTSIPTFQKLSNIGKKAFFNCSKIEEIATQPSLVELSDSALDLRNVKEFPNLPKLRILGQGVFSNAGLSTFPDLPSLESANIGAFEGNNFEVVNLPKLKYLYDNSFGNCKNLKTVILENVIAISNQPFRGCNSLERIEIPSATNFWFVSFEGLTNLKEVVLSSLLTTIPENMFKGCKSLSTFTFPSGLIEIGDYAFENTAIKELVFTNNLKKIGNGAFKGVVNVESVTIPGSVTNLGFNCFQGMTGVKSLTFEAGEPLNGADFEQNSANNIMSLEKVDIRRDVEWCGFTPTTGEEYEQYRPSSVSYSSTLYPSLKEVWIHDINKTYPAPFVGPNANVIIDCEYMNFPPAQEIYPNSNYGENRFERDEWKWRDNFRIEKYESFINIVKRVTLGPNMKSVWAECFHDVKELRCLAINPPALLKGNFTNMTYLKTELYVPEESLSAYQNAPGWSDFFIIKPIPADELSGVEEIVASENPCEPEYYDLTGRRVTSPEKGIYILKDKSGVRKVIL